MKSLNLDLFTVELWSLWCDVVTHRFSVDCFNDSLVALLGHLLVDHIVHRKFDPGRSEHVVNEAILVEAPVETHFAHLIPDQVVICVHKRIHVTVQSLQTVDCFNIEFNLNKVLRICADDEIHIVPIWEEELLDDIYDVAKGASADSLDGFRGTSWAEVAVEQLGLLDPSRFHSLVFRNFVGISWG